MLFLSDLILFHLTSGSLFYISIVLGFIYAPLQAFLEACYHADNLPLRTPPEVVDNFGMVLQEMKVRKNSKDLRPVATPQAASCAAADATGLEQQMGFKMSTLMLEQSKALDALKHEMELSKMTLPRASSSHSLSSADVSPHTSSFLSSKALDRHPDPLPLPAPAGPEASGHGDLAGNPAQKDALVKMTLEDYENEAKQRLSNKKAKELDEEMTTMKRPASKKVGKAQPKGKVTRQKGVLKEKKQHVKSSFLKGIYGCTRCRGNVRGCNTCRSPAFGGLRFSSRDEYNKWYQKKQQSDNKRK